MVKFRLPKSGGGIGAHYDYSPIIPSKGKEILSWVKTAKKICEADNFDLFCDFFMHERHGKSLLSNDGGRHILMLMYVYSHQRQHVYL